MTPSYEENPFETELGSAEWSYSIENEKGMIRDKELYPMLTAWIKSTKAKTIVDIGSGQGICSDRCVPDTMHYIGIEPSIYLTKRAEELYKKENREFIVGNAYDLPLPNESADAAFSINVWFHLENLTLASKELSRILKPNAPFLIGTANPESYDVFESLYTDAKKEGKVLTGTAHVPVKPLSKNIFYEHTLEEVKEALDAAGLKIVEINSFGFSHLETKKGLFINIIGIKG